MLRPGCRTGFLGGPRVADVKGDVGATRIFGCEDLERPLYIGKGGTVETDGSWKNQD